MPLLKIKYLVLDALYLHQVYRGNQFDYYIDAYHLSTSNWLRFVRYLRRDSTTITLSKERHNIEPQECYGRIFYKAVNDITPGQELVVSDPVPKVKNVTKESMDLQIQLSVQRERLLEMVVYDLSNFISHFFVQCNNQSNSNKQWGRTLVWTRHPMRNE